MTSPNELISVLTAWSAEGRVIVRLIGDRTDSGLERPAWANNETVTAQTLIDILNSVGIVSRETRGTKKLASLPPASRKRVMEAKAACEKRVKEMDVSTRRKRRKAA